MLAIVKNITLVYETFWEITKNVYMLPASRNYFRRPSSSNMTSYFATLETDDLNKIDWNKDRIDYLSNYKNKLWKNVQCL